jgi:hypothetical protein
MNRTCPSCHSECIRLPLPVRAIWRGSETLVWPKYGQTGTVVSTAGYDDPESAEYLSLLFMPDGEDEASYCESSDLQFVETK